MARVSRVTRDELAAFWLPLIIIVPLAFDSGGFFAPSWGWASLELLAVLVVALALWDGLELATADLVGWALVASFALLILASGLWSVDLTKTMLSAERSAVYAIGFLAALLVVRRAAVRAFLAGIALTTVVVALATLSTNYFPGTFGAQNDPLARGQVYLPVGYWNGLGCMMAIGIVLLLGVAIDVEPRKRILCGIAAAIDLWAMVLTQSRGTALAAVIGFGVCLLLRRGRTPPPAAVGAAAAVVGVVGVLALAPAALAAAARSVSDPSWFALTGRGSLWSVAWQEFQDHPLFGSGSATWVAYWSKLRPSGHNVGNPHSLYLQTLGELGIVGLVLLVCALAVPWVVGVRSRQSPNVAVAVGAYAVFCVSVAVDWDWELTSVGLMGLWCGAAVLIASRGQVPRVRVPAPYARGLLIALCVVAAIPLGLALAGNTLISRAAGAYHHGRYAQAVTDAHRAARFMPWSYEPAVWQGEATLAMHRPASAQRFFEHALSKPDGRGVWRLWWDMARSTTGDARIANLRRVAALNPRSPEVKAMCRLLRTGGGSPINRYCRTLHRPGQRNR